MADDPGKFEIEFYIDDASEWRWRAVAGNNRIVGASTEGYREYDDAVANWKLLHGGVVVDDPPDLDEGFEYDDPPAEPT